MSNDLRETRSSDVILFLDGFAEVIINNAIGEKELLELMVLCGDARSNGLGSDQLKSVIENARLCYALLMVHKGEV